jgi:myo-inositol-1(or 4)-monophosphatase
MQPAPSNAELLEVAEQAARAAGVVACQGFRTVLDIRSKGGTDIVTQYDNAAEEAALSIVRKCFPTHSFLAEESGASGNREKPHLIWMIDPIDGTHNYASQIPFWCVSVAVTDSSTNAVLAGVIYDALHEELFAASLGGGATVNGKPISVTNKSDVSQAIVAYDIGHNPDIASRMVDLVAWVQPRVAKVRHLGSAALSLTYVAAGRIDAYYHLSLQPWDIAAALLLIQEAGGTVTDWHGSPRLSGSGSAIASGKLLHPSLLNLLRTAQG